MSSLNRDSRATAGRRLSRLLNGWAAARRLTPQQASAVRQRVVAVSADLGFAWWWRLLDPECGTAFGGAASGMALGGARNLSSAPPSSETDAPALALWSQDEAEYQPYLRLT